MLFLQWKKKVQHIKNHQMKNKILLLLASNLLLLACEKKELCKEGYKEHTQNGQTFCIPDYVGSKSLDSKLGNTYYHKKYGVITIQNGIWKDMYGITIENIDE